ncbi:TolB-like translocation protein [Anditalea andensis]|uniref:Uncharacterized protein n=1 Tax=Anditalea andensis TaxID=1048983 RepID=A0A074KYB7_9BACT|nr:hypothetical protein [Anditalea andensis]KEO73949.1 hypothetical protein EL17_07285 [Anditalea andensis]
MKLTTLYVLLLSILLPVASHAQGSFDIISLDTKSRFGRFQIVPHSASKITDRIGYDNQPNFINEKQLVFSSKPDQGHHDIIMYNFETQKFTNITRTDNKSEFSPSLTDCGLYVSAITVEEDSTQRLWLYPINMGEPELLYDNIYPVGYYDWYDNKAVMFVLGSPNKLIYPYSRDEVDTLSQNVGRSIKKRPGTSQMAYISKNNNVVVDGKPVYEMVSYDLKKKEIKNIGLTLPYSEDFIWVGKNHILMASEQSIYIKNVRKNNSWQEIAKVSLPGYGNISRMAISPKSKKLVVVMERN